MYLRRRACCRIVGDDDGGVLFTPEQYEAYKKKVIPQRMENRLFVSWVSPSGIECKMIGPETMCFCRHRYRQHKTDLEKIPETRPIKVACSIKGCGCKSYEYVPLNGSRTIKCRCKHFADVHAERAPHKCKSIGCDCRSFYSSYTCGCGDPTYSHSMIIETKEERAARGRPIGNAVPYQAMGGLTGFSSLADGYMRLDDSGIGVPSREFLEKPIGPDDHPFLRMYKGFQNLSVEGSSGDVGHLVRKQTTEEEDMAFFEKRYQERLKQEKEKARERAQKVLASKRERANADRARAKTAQSSKIGAKK